MDLHINMSRQENGANPFIRRPLNGKGENNPVVIQAQKMADLQINQIMRGAKKQEAFFSDTMQKYKDELVENKKLLDKAFSSYKENVNEKQAKKEEFGISDEEAKLLDKAFLAEKGEYTLTEEEAASLDALRGREGVSDYEGFANRINESMLINHEDMQKCQKDIKNNTFMIQTVYLESLKVNPMQDAEKQVDKIKEETAKSIAVGLIGQAKDNIDKHFEEIKEKKEEEEKEEKEKEEQKQEKNADNQVKSEAIKEEVANMDDSDVTDKIAASEEAMAKTNAKMQEIQKKLKELEDILSGNFINTYA